MRANEYQEYILKDEIINRIKKKYNIDIFDIRYKAFVKVNKIKKLKLLFIFKINNSIKNFYG